MIHSTDYRVEQRLPPHGDVEGDVQVGLVAAGVELHIPKMCELSFIHPKSESPGSPKL